MCVGGESEPGADLTECRVRFVDFEINVREFGECDAEDCTAYAAAYYGDVEGFGVGFGAHTCLFEVH